MHTYVNFWAGACWPSTDLSFVLMMPVKLPVNVSMTKEKEGKKPNRCSFFFFFGRRRNKTAEFHKLDACSVLTDPIQGSAPMRLPVNITWSEQNENSQDEKSICHSGGFMTFWPWSDSWRAFRLSYLKPTISQPRGPRRICQDFQDI